MRYLLKYQQNLYNLHSNYNRSNRYIHNQSYKNLYNKYQKLKEENNKLKEENNKIKKENKELKEELLQKTRYINLNSYSLFNKVK